MEIFLIFKLDAETGDVLGIVEAWEDQASAFHKSEELNNDKAGYNYMVGSTILKK